MNFARWSRMSPRDRMLAGLSGAFMPTHGVQVSAARGVQLGIAPLAGLGLVNTSTVKSDSQFVQLSPAQMFDDGKPNSGISYGVPVRYAGTRVINNPASGSIMQPPVRQISPMTQINRGAPTSMSTSSGGGSTDPRNDPDYGYDTGSGTSSGTPGTSDDYANAAAADAGTDQVNAQNPVANVEDIQKANVKALVSASSANASVFDTVPKWVWPVGLAVAAWFVFKK